MKQYDLFAIGDSNQNGKSYEITVPKAKSPWTVTVIGDYKALLEWRKTEVVRMAIVQERSDAKAAEARALAMSHVEGQNAAPDVRNCECGAISSGYHQHSTWCPIFKLDFSRNKTSFIPINTGNDD